MHAKSFQLCPTHCDPMESSLPGTSVRGIFQARVLEWYDHKYSILMHIYIESRKMVLMNLFAEQE